MKSLILAFNPAKLRGKSARKSFRSKHQLLKPIGRVLIVSLLLQCILILYLLIWAVVYRLPHTPPALVDLRQSTSDRPYYVAICAGLASNIHGFPGHGYVVWSETLPIDLSHAESRGFVPMLFADQIPSLWQTVPGLLVTNATEGNLRNFDAVVVVVNRESFDKSRQLSCSWKSDDFKVGSRDCVGYANSIASGLGLKVPDARHKYPQDYVIRLKAVNQLPLSRSTMHPQPWFKF